MEICKAPTLRLKVLNKHTHIKYIKMENVVQKINVYYIYRQVFKHNYAKDAHAHIHTFLHNLTSLSFFSHLHIMQVLILNVRRFLLKYWA